MDEHPGPTATSDRALPRPAGLLLAAVSVGLQAVAVLVVAVLEILHLTSVTATMAVTTTLFLVAYGAGLGWCARGLFQASSWARGPVVMAQLIMLGLAWNVRSSNTSLSVVLSVVAVVTLVAVLSPASRAALEGE